MAVNTKKKAPAKTATSSKANKGASSAQQGKIVKSASSGKANPKKKKKKLKKKKGDPIAVATGTVIDDVLDLELPGMIPFEWRRTYSSADADETTPLGRGGWTHSFHQWIEEEDDGLVLRNDDQSDVSFDKPEPRGTAFHRGSRLELTRGADGRFEVRSLDTRLARAFAPIAPGGPAMLASVRDAWGNKIELAYEGGRLWRIVDTAGREIRVVHDDRARVTALEVWVDGQEFLRHAYAYTDAGELASTADAIGNGYGYEYDGLHRIVKKTLPTGISFHYVYDPDHGRCVKTWGDGGVHCVEFTYDFDAKTTTTHGEPQPRIFTWDDSGVVLKEETFDGDFVEEEKFDDDLHLVSNKNAAGEEEIYEHDARGNIVKHVDRAGNVTTYAYADDLVVEVTRPDGAVTRYSYDTRGAMESNTFPWGDRYTMAWDGRGRLSGVFGANGRLAQLEYDDRHDLTREVDARGGGFHYVHDALGRPVERTDALGRTTKVEHDAVGRPVRVRYPDASTSEIAYDAHGSVVRTVDRRGRATTMEYVGTGALSRLVEPDGREWTITYDREEKPLVVQNPKAERFEYRYDAAGRIREERTFDGRTLRYAYSRTGRLARIDYADGTFRAFEHDPLGNITLETSTHGPQIYKRDAMGRLLEAIVDEGAGKTKIFYERDALGRVVAESQNDHTIRFEYDERGRRAARIMPGGETTRYFYDVLDSLAAVDHDGHKVLIERDRMGREQRRHVYAGGVDILSAWDPMNQLVARQATRGARGTAEVLSRRAFTYDTVGRVTSIEDSRWGTTRYGYDESGRLADARRGDGHVIFDYDAASSVQAVRDALGRGRTWGVAQGNVLLHTPDAEYGYDDRRRRTKKTRLAGEQPTRDVTEYVWDCRDRLREVKLPSGERVLYMYDALGRRTRKEIVPAPPPPGDIVSDPGRVRVVEYLWDENTLAAEIDNLRGQRVFVHELGTLTPMLQQEQGEVLTYVTDHLGTPKELIDARGKVAWSAAHTPWGNVEEAFHDTAGRARPIESPFRTLGQYFDEETGLAYARFRYFDAETARFLSPDPYGLYGGMNLHGFDGSPTVFVDPFGLCQKLGSRALPRSKKPWVKYQKHATGKTREDMWEVNGRSVGVDARNQTPNGPVIVEAKWTGNERQWSASPYNPNHEFYNQSAILAQAQGHLDLNAASGGAGVRYAVSSTQGADHFNQLFQQHFPNEMANGTLQVWHVPGNGM